MPTVADLIVCELRKAGVRALFGVPGGGGNLDLIAAAGRAGLPFVLTSTETAAAIAAVAQTEITGQAGACLTTLGPGAASVVNGIACAFLDRAPVLAFTDSYSSTDFEHQRIDHQALFAPIVKSSVKLSAEDAWRAIAGALETAISGRPGPVHVDCPGEVLTQSRVPGFQGFEVPGFLSSRTKEAGTKERGTQELRNLVGTAKKPLLIVGLGARRPAEAFAIRSLCDGRGIPAMVTYKAKGVVPDDHQWFAGVFTNAAIEQDMIDESDVIIGIGLDPVELIPRPWKRKQPVVCCGRWPVEDAHIPLAAQIVGDIADTLLLIEEALSSSEWSQDRVRFLVDEQKRRVSVPGDGMTAQRMVEIAAPLLSTRVGRVTVDAGAHMFPITMLWPARDPSGMLISNGLSTMGFALPAAIGAALLDRSPVIALTGDGGLLMCAGELLTVVRERLRIVTIVLNDASLSLIEIKQQARRLPAAGVALGAVNWRALAESFGLPAWTASDEAGLELAIDRALACDGPSLIEARIDRSNYGSTMSAVRG